MDIQERTVTMKGNPLPLSGTLPEKGEPAPDFSAVANDFSEFKLSSLKGKHVVLLSVASLDTSVCDLEVKRFNREAGSLSPDLEIVAISMDLPFAQGRWCGTSEVDRVRAVSDHREGQFGRTYGVLIEPLRLLARAVFIIDNTGIVRYVQLVPEVSQEPDYEDVLREIKSLV